MLNINTFEDIYNIIAESILSNIDRSDPLSYDGIVELWGVIDIPMTLTKSVVMLLKRIYVAFNDRLEIYASFDTVDSYFEDLDDDGEFFEFLKNKFINDPINYYTGDMSQYNNMKFKKDNLLYYLIACHLVVLKEYLINNNIKDNKLVNIINCSYLYEGVDDDLVKSNLNTISYFLSDNIFTLYKGEFRITSNVIESPYKNYDEVIKKALTGVDMTKSAKELIYMYVKKQVYLRQVVDDNRKKEGETPFIKSFTKLINSNMELLLNNINTTVKINELNVIEAIMFSGEKIFEYK